MLMPIEVDGGLVSIFASGQPMTPPPPPTPTHPHPHTQYRPRRPHVLLLGPPGAHFAQCVQATHVKQMRQSEQCTWKAGCTVYTVEQLSLDPQCNAGLDALCALDPQCRAQRHDGRCFRRYRPPQLVADAPSRQLQRGSKVNVHLP